MIVPLKLRLVTLVSLMRSLVAKANQAIKTGQQTSGTRIIIFLSCTDSVDFHWQLLGGVQMGAGSSAAKVTNGKKDDQVAHNCALLPSTSIIRLHGSLPVATRRASLQAFAAPNTVTDGNQNSILLCTSVASRGLDLPLVKAVIQYDLPTEQGINEYVHRVGRTARVGRGGESWAFVEDHEKGWVDWAESGMSNKGDQVQLRQVAVEDVLRRGFGGGNAQSHIEYEARATQVQLAFERWVLESDEVRYSPLCNIP
jgi:ATP-dependent RNA helicase DDX31/DBP7